MAVSDQEKLGRQVKVLATLSFELERQTSRGPLEGALFAIALIAAAYRHPEWGQGLIDACPSPVPDAVIAEIVRAIPVEAIS